MTTWINRTLLAAGLMLAPGAVAHAELSDVTKRGELRVVMSGEYPPFSQPAASGGLVGFDVDVANEIGRRLGVKTRVIKAEFSSIIPACRAVSSTLRWRRRARLLNVKRPSISCPGRTTTTASSSSCPGRRR